MMQLLIRNLNDRTIVLDVSPVDTIAEVKAKLQEREGIPAIEQNLLCPGGHLREDWWTLQDCGVEGDSVLTLLLSLRGGVAVFVKGLDGKTIQVEVSQDDTIWNVKKKIQGKIGMAPEVQRLIYATKYLDDTKMISDYNVLHESTFHLVQKLKGGRQ